MSKIHHGYQARLQSHSAITQCQRCGTAVERAKLDTHTCPSSGDVKRNVADDLTEGKCYLCSKEFDSQVQLVLHMQRDHKKNLVRP